MRKEIFHLSSCSTCARIIKQVDPQGEFRYQDIKGEGIQPEQLEEMKEKAGSYEALFSRRAMKYRSLGLNEQELGEADYKKWILEEYTFLKRPVIWVGEELFVGNSKKTVAAVVTALGHS